MHNIPCLQNKPYRMQEEMSRIRIVGFAVNCDSQSPTSILPASAHTSLPVNKSHLAEELKNKERSKTSPQQMAQNYGARLPKLRLLPRREDNPCCSGSPSSCTSCQATSSHRRRNQTVAIQIGASRIKSEEAEHRDDSGLSCTLMSFVSGDEKTC